MLLSDKAIKEHLERGSILIDPFVPERLGNTSYDLSLGAHIIRYRYPSPGAGFRFFDAEKGVDLRDPDQVKAMFDVPEDTEAAGGFTLHAGERLLAHTRESASGMVSRCGKYATNGDLHATSTAARLGISVHTDAGWGDVGYGRPWTLELRSSAPWNMWIPYGAILCQIVFMECAPPERLYRDWGTYGTASADRKDFGPADMLPRTVKVAPTEWDPGVRR